MGAAITGWGIALPSRELHNAELEDRLGMKEGWIFERTGIQTRRIADDSQTTASLSTEAGSAALQRAGMAADDLDMILVATCTPDYQMPATACLVQAALGANRAGAADINAACSGFLYGLAQAEGLVGTGTARTVLVIGADVLSRITDFDDPKSGVLFGDGAGAAVVQHFEGPSRLGPFRLRADGSRPELLWVPETGGCIAMEGREVYRRAVDGMSTTIKEAVADAGLSIDDVDVVVAHQANGRIVQAVATRLGLPAEKVMLNIARYGNTSAASIPIAFSEAVESGMLEDGDVAVLTAFGAGFAWGSGVVRWGAPVEDRGELAYAGEAHA
ncbi:MAG: beta-ketoacyl-ACP synthase III [Actinomycetota bacterium]